MSKARPQSMTRALRRNIKGREQVITTEIKGYYPVDKVITVDGEKRTVQVMSQKKKILAPGGRIAVKAKEPRIVTEFIDTFNKVFIMRRSRCGHNRAQTTYRKGNPNGYYQLIGTI